MAAKHQGLVIGYPHNGSVAQPFMKSLMAFREHDLTHRRILAGVDDQWGAYIAGNRNVMARRFLEGPAEWFLAIDSDQRFEPEMVYALMDDADAKERPIVCGLYFGCIQGHYAPMWWNLNDRGEYSTVTRIEPGLQPLDAAGLGFTLIHRGVFEEMAIKHRDDPWTWFGHDVGKFGGVAAHLGEDFTFFRRAIAMGYRLWGDGRLIIGHMKTLNLDLNMFMRMADIIKPGEENAPVREQVLDTAA